MLTRVISRGLELVMEEFLLEYAWRKRSACGMPGSLHVGERCACHVEALQCVLGYCFLYMTRTTNHTPV
jgi:hypothetical protein